MFQAPPVTFIPSTTNRHVSKSSISKSSLDGMSSPPLAPSSFNSSSLSMLRADSGYSNNDYLRKGSVASLRRDYPDEDVHSVQSSDYGYSTYSSEYSSSRSRAPTAPTEYSDDNNNNNLTAYDFTEQYAIIDELYDIYADDAEEEYIDVELNFRKRESAVQEIYETEVTYVNGLRLLQKVFIQPMRQNVETELKKKGLLGSSNGKPICTENDLTLLYGNAEQILELHEQLLKTLDERAHIWGPTQIISDIFLHMNPYLRMYTNYLKNFPSAIIVMEKLNKTSPLFKKFLDQCHEDPSLDKMPLISYLMLPIQRIPRYRMLLESLFKYTSPLHPDYRNLSRCCEQINVICNEVNEKIRDAENQQRVLEIQTSVQGLGDPLIAPHRRFILKGDMFKINPGNASSVEPRTYFLFNDMLLCVKAKDRGTYQFKGTIDLSSAQVRDLDDTTLTDQPHCFQVTSLVYNGATHYIRAGSKQDKTEWILRLNEVISSMKDKSKQMKPNGISPFPKNSSSSDVSTASPRLGPTTPLSPPLSPSPSTFASSPLSRTQTASSVSSGDSTETKKGPKKDTKKPETNQKSKQQPPAGKKPGLETLMSTYGMTPGTSVTMVGRF